MKYIKCYESVSIDSICNRYGIRNYTVNDDNSIDVNGNVRIEFLLDSKLPIKFRNVIGNFDCLSNGLKTLEGSPKNVEGNFNCSMNYLKSLSGGPEFVGGEFNCNRNELKSLIGGPKEVGTNFECGYNEINSLEEECFICFHKKKLNIFCMICKTNPFCTNCYNNLQTKVCPLCRKPL